MKTLYISGPIHGNEDHYDDFRKTAHNVRRQLDVDTLVPQDVAPHKHTGPCPPGRRSPGSDHTECCYLHEDLISMLGCQGIVLQNGWRHSSGARIEFQVALHCGLEIWLEKSDGRLEQFA